MTNYDDDFLALVRQSILRANKAMIKFPQPNYVLTKVAEESGEVVKAGVHCAEGRDTTEHVREEIVDLIAMLYRLYVEGDKVIGLQPVGGFRE